MLRHPQNLFGKRLRSARERIGIPQDKLGIAIGLDEGCASARISRYETGVHEPALVIATKLAQALKVPTAYFYCQRDSVADLLLAMASLSEAEIALLKKAMSRIVRKRETTARPRPTSTDT